jgi:hypothetical protein
MSSKKPEGGSSVDPKILEEQKFKKEADALLKQIKKESSNFENQKALFDGDPEGLNEFLAAQKNDPLEAAGIWLAKSGELKKGNKKEFDKIKGQLELYAKMMTNEVDTLSGKKEIKTPEPEPKKEEKEEVAAETEESKLVAEMIALGAKKEEAEKTIEQGIGAALNWIHEKEGLFEEEKTPQKGKKEAAAAKPNPKEESAKLLRQIRLLDLQRAGYKPEDLAGKSDADLSALILETQSVEKQLKADAFIALQFLKTRMTRAKIKALGNDNVAIIRAAEERSKMTMAEIKQYQIDRSPTARELDRILTPMKLEVVRRMIENKKTRIITHKKPDLDSKAAMYILQVLGGAGERTIEEVEKGTKFDDKENLDAILLDVGGSEDIATILKGYWETDHHFEDAWIKTSTAETMLETLSRSGNIEKIEPWMREFVTFVTDVDNMSYPRGDKESFKTVYPRSILGLRDMLSIETIADFFKAGKSPYEPLTEADFALEVTDARGKKQPLGQLVKIMEFRTRQSIRAIEKYEDRNIALGQKTFSNEFGKVLFYEPMDGDDWNIPLGSHAVYNMGYDLYVRFDPKEKFYFVSYAGEDLTRLKTRMSVKDPNIKIVRESMLISQGDKEDPKATIALQEHELVNYIGINMPKNPSGVETAVEYETNRILRAQASRKTVFANQLEGVKEMFVSNILRTAENIRSIEGWISEKTEKPTKDSESKMNMLGSQIVLLQHEKNLWEKKLLQAEAIKKTSYAEFWNLRDKSKLGKKEAGAPKENEAAVTERIQSTPEEIAAQLEEVQREYDAVTAKLETDPGREVTMEETIDLVVQRYNLWKLGYFLQEGGQGEPPEALTWAEIKPILDQEDAEAGAAAPAKVEEKIEAVIPVVEEVAATPVLETTTTVEKEPVMMRQTFFNDGSYVEKGQPIYEIETDKATQEVLAENSGYIFYNVVGNEEIQPGQEAVTITPKTAVIEIAEKLKATKGLNDAEKAIYKMFAYEINKLVTLGTPTKKEDPNKLFPGDHENDEESENKIERTLITTEEMQNFIGDTIAQMLADKTSNSVKYGSLILSPLSKKDDRLNFSYLKSTGEKTSIKIEGQIRLPDSSEPYFFALITPSGVVDASEGNTLMKGLRNLNLRFLQSSDREAIATGERNRLESALNKALKEKFNDKLPTMIS